MPAISYQDGMRGAEWNVTETIGTDGNASPRAIAQLLLGTVVVAIRIKFKIWSAGRHGLSIHDALRLGDVRDDFSWRGVPPVDSAAFRGAPFDSLERGRIIGV